MTSSQKYYTVGTQTIAVRTVAGERITLQWLLGDHLGSTSVTASADGSYFSELRYSAFGEIRYSYNITPTDYRYTGQLAQAEVGLYYYGARWYDSALGRFVQPDTIVPGVGNPIAWDRYAYVNNNPIKLIDPAGHTAVPITWIYKQSEVDNSGSTWNNANTPFVQTEDTVFVEDLSTYESIIQDPYGDNSCGPVAASLGSRGLIDSLKGACGTESDYHSPEGHGIQPSDLTSGSQYVYKTQGVYNVVSRQNWTIDDYFDFMSVGYRFVVDIGVNQDGSLHTGSGDPYFAHFAQILGIDRANELIYIENTIRHEGEPSYWVISFDEFLVACNNPEINAQRGPVQTQREEARNWGLAIYLPN